MGQQQESLDRLLGRVARDLSAEPGVQQTLDRAVDLAAGLVDGELLASIARVHRDRLVATSAASDERARHADHLQAELQQGPCLDVVRERGTCVIDDLAGDGRYPLWARRVVDDTGIASGLCCRLPAPDDTGGALTFYSLVPRAFADPRVRDAALAVAGQVAVAVTSARTAETLRAGLATRTVIGQAQGILMERYKMTADEAFAVLQRTSQDRNVKLRVVAEQLVHTGEIPGVPRPPAG